jgi:hypothetical protein
MDFRERKISCHQRNVTDTLLQSSTSYVCVCIKSKEINRLNSAKDELRVCFSSARPRSTLCASNNKHSFYNTIISILYFNLKSNTALDVVLFILL